MGREIVQAVARAVHGGTKARERDPIVTPAVSSLQGHLAAGPRHKECDKNPDSPDERTGSRKGEEPGEGAQITRMSRLREKVSAARGSDEGTDSLRDRGAEVGLRQDSTAGEGRVL